MRPKWWNLDGQLQGGMLDPNGDRVIRGCDRGTLVRRNLDG
jgi:hypothetical protein